MKNILIIRSANMNVIDKLINYIISKSEKEKIKLYCLIQKSSLSSFSGKYNFINFIEKEDGFFCYKNFKNNKELRKKVNSIDFDEIYIPSSTADFRNFEEAFMIASKIKADKNILFNCNREICDKKLNFYLVCFDKYFGEIIYFIKLIFVYMFIFITYIFSYFYYFIKNKLKCFFRKTDFYS